MIIMDNRVGYISVLWILFECFIMKGICWVIVSCSMLNVVFGYDGVVVVFLYLVLILILLIKLCIVYKLFECLYCVYEYGFVFWL